MKVLIFGATGMVGGGVLRECLIDETIEQVVTVGRTPTGIQDPKLREIIRPNLENYDDVESQWSGFAACFFCLGTPSAGKTEAEYTRITYDLTMAAAQVLARRSPEMTFVYVSGIGADSSETSPTMWARVRGKTENALLRLPFKAVYIFRPGVIQPRHGIRSKTAIYRIFYQLATPLMPLARWAFPNSVTTTEHLGRAMIRVVQGGAEKPILTSPDFERLAASR